MPADGLSEEDISRMHLNLERKLDNQLTLTIRLVEDILISVGAKVIYVDQRIRPEK